MGCRNRELLEEESAVSVSLSDALIFSTMCIVGLPVDVHVKDGSIYSGIFHTACLEKNYGIVLKRARMTKKCNCDANVANGGLIETLVVLSEDLVQVVAKEVLLSSDGIVGNFTGDDVEDIAGAVSSTECAESKAKMRKHRESNLYLKQINQTRSLVQIETEEPRGFALTTVRHLGNAPEVEKRNSDGIQLAKKGGASRAPLNERQVGGGRSQGKHGDYEQTSELQKEETTQEAQGSSSSFDARLIQLNAVGDCGKITPNLLPNGAIRDNPAPSIVKVDDQCQERHTSNDFPCSNAISSGLPTSVTSLMYVTSESCHSSSSPIEMAPPKSSGSNRSAKEFKLNPGAKIFRPSFSNHRSTTPPVVPAITSVSYIPDNCPVVPIAAAEPDVEINTFSPRTSPPVKFVPISNLMTGNDSSDSQYAQPIVGHVGSRTQPIRYAGQYHPLQAGPAYVHPNSLNVMVGRLGGQLVYVHPVSHDVTQGAAALSQVSTRPLLTPHQVHLPKHQGLNTINHASNHNLCDNGAMQS
ncbi:uncharacterized protein LOC132311091 isoform X2 [Cornus florida]|uniref:uncharacterized protein LOC132311091 isoform X2 n=1 Tax=Cornus florida TaxID=4283 RepID=UPI00289B9E4A|nr:uncharacterized protein LOC132311091 isoform X2 [Cornus florida]